MSLDAINAQIAAARGAAASVAQQVAVAPTVGVGVPALAQPGKPVTLGEVFAQGGLSVDKYIKVDKAGFAFGDDTQNYFEEVEVELKLSDVIAFWGVRFGNPAKYLKSFDRQVEARSKKPWANVVAEAQAADSRCRGDYPSADIPMTVLAPLVGSKGENKGKTIVDRGQTIGLTLSVTNFKDFKTWAKPINDLIDAGQLPRDQIFRGKLVHTQKKNTENVWGAATFVNFVAVEVSSIDAEAEAA